MIKLIFTAALIFCSSLVYGQFETVKRTIGIEQETVYNQIYANRRYKWANPIDININGRVCRVFVKKLVSAKEYTRAVEEVMALLANQEVNLGIIPNNLPLEFYFTNGESYQPDFRPLYPAVEQYDGIGSHNVLVLTHMSDWSTVCKIITPLSAKKHNSYLKNRLVYAMGRILHEFKQDERYYWSPTALLNNLNQSRVGTNTVSEHVQLGRELNRSAIQSTKAFAAELFVYGVYDDLDSALPSSSYYRSRALKFYFDECNGPMSYALRRYKAK